MTHEPGANNRGRTTVVFADQENFTNIIPARADVGSQGEMPDRNRHRIDLA